MEAPFSLPLPLDPDTALDLILESLSELVDYELAVVLGLDRDGDLRVRKARGPLYTARLEGFSIRLDARQDLRSIIEREVPHLFASGQDEGPDTYHEILDLPEGHSCLVAPLHVKGRPLGLLTFDHRSCGRFSPSIIRFVGSMARLVALVLAQTDRSSGLETANLRLVEERNRLLGREGSAFEGLVGASPAWRRALEAVRLCAASDVPVLVRGETGTGKEGIARAVHRLSGRSAAPFVALNCSALSESLAESELFGHEKGAFTGAQVQRKGRFELADGGTLFLDEIGDLPRGLQPKLLRALQEGRFERVGGERTLEVDVRVVAATHVDLEAAIAGGRFREDLYYRLNVFPIQLPPLRERPEDIVVLAAHALKAIQARHQTAPVSSLQSDVPAVSPQALAFLEARPWPGNVRELENALERAYLLAGGGPIEVGHLRGAGGAPLACAEAFEGEALPSSGGGQSVATWDEGSRAVIRRALAHSGGRIYGSDGAAALLGLKPSTLQSKMERLGLR